MFLLDSESPLPQPLSHCGNGLVVTWCFVASAVSFCLLRSPFSLAVTSCIMCVHFPFAPCFSTWCGPHPLWPPPTTRHAPHPPWPSPSTRCGPHPPWPSPTTRWVPHHSRPVSPSCAQLVPPRSTTGSQCWWAGCDWKKLPSRQPHV